MSAIAARKARLAAQNASAEGLNIPLGGPSSDAQASPSPKEGPRRAKRKAKAKDEGEAGSTTKKGRPVAASKMKDGEENKSKAQAEGKGSSRYFQASETSNGNSNGHGLGLEGTGAEDTNPAVESTMQDDFVAFPQEEDDDSSSDEDASASEGEMDEPETGPAEVAFSQHQALGFSLPPTRGTWMPNESNCISFKGTKGKERQGSTKMLVGLSANDTLPFVGAVHITVLKGAVTVSGAHLRANQPSALVFAPKNGPVPVIETLEHDEEVQQLSEYPISAANFLTVILVSSSSSGVEGIGAACPLPRHLFSSPKYFTTDDQRAASRLSPLPGFYPVFDTPIVGLQAAYMPPSQSRALDLLQEDAEQAYVSQGDASEVAFTCLVRGPKRVGKSTFARHALHAVLTSRKYAQVAFLETDLGQTEFGPPGAVSLHLFDARETIVIGPSWSSLRIPLRSHFIGDTTPRDDPDRYLEAIRDLVAFFHREVRRGEEHRIPLLVNTQGWIKGLGADLIGRIEEMTCPTHVFDIFAHEAPSHSLNPVRGHTRLDADGAIIGPGSIIVPLEPAPMMLVKDRGPSAAEARTRSLISYLYSTTLPLPAWPNRTPDPPPVPTWNFGRSLLEVRPLIVDVASGLRGGIHILPTGATPKPELQLAALNASLVALVRVDQDADTVDGQEGESVWRDALSRSLPSAANSTCLGYAIVRSIDVAAGQVHLITPTPAAAFSELPSNSDGGAKKPALALVKGAIDVPVLASLDFDTIAAAQRGDLSSSTSQERTMAGLPLSLIPYLEFPRDEQMQHSHVQDPLQRDEQEGMASLSMAKRKVRRNIQRRSQR